jgi:hypothetical protein
LLDGIVESVLLSPLLGRIEAAFSLVLLLWIFARSRGGSHRFGRHLKRLARARPNAFAYGQPETQKGDQQRSLSKRLCAIVPAKEPLIKLRFARRQRKLFCEPLSALLWKTRSESLQLFTVLSDQGLKPCKTRGIGCLQVRKSGAKKF